MKKTFKVVMLHTEKEGNWYLNAINQLFQCGVHSQKKWLIGNRICKKVIASTDKSLGYNLYYISIAGTDMEEFISLPQVPKSFIQAYIKAYNEGKPIIEVDLEYEQDKNIKECDCYYTKFCKSTQLGEGIKCRDQKYSKLKTNPDNTVIISPKVDRVYTREEMVHFYNLGRDDVRKSQASNKYIDNHLEYL